MSGSDKLKEAGRRFARDLKDLREERQVDVEVLLEATRLPPDILEKFDESALVDHPAFNRVYLRSIVASYARVLKIDASVAKEALEQAIAGTYKDSLRTEFLNRGIDAGLATAFVGVEEVSETETASLEPEGVETLGKTASTDSVPAPLPEAVIDPIEKTKASVTENQFSKAIKPDRETRLAQPALAVKRQKKSFLSPKVIFISVALLLCSVLVYVLWPSPGGTETGIGNGKDDVTLSPETGTVQAVPSVSIPESIILPDSMQFLVIAVFDHADPIRISRDRWARRPYWISLGDSMIVRAANRVVFESDIEATRIELHGFALSDSLVDDSGRIDLPRERAQAWLNAAVLSGASPAAVSR